MEGRQQQTTPAPTKPTATTARDNDDHHLMMMDQRPPPLYYVTTALCVFMVGWILIFPSSAMQEHSAWRKQLFDKYVRADSSTPPELIRKYTGQYLVQATHILPSALWSALIPFQLHPYYRHKYPQLHRGAGYVFWVTALVMSYGVGLILHRQLGFEHYFPDLKIKNGYNNHHSASAGNGDDDDDDIVWTSVEPGLLVLTVYFAATVSYAVYCAATAHRYHDEHQKYIIRHIAAGIWIAVQRIILLMVLPVLKLGRPFTRLEQRTNFARSGLVAMAVTILAGEYVIYQLPRTSSSTRSLTALRRQKRVD